MEKYDPSLPLYMLYIPRGLDKKTASTMMENLSNIGLQVLPLLDYDEKFRFECIHEGFKMLEVKEKIPIFEYSNVNELLNNIKKHIRNQRIDRVIEKL